MKVKQAEATADQMGDKDNSDKVPKVAAQRVVKTR